MHAYILQFTSPLSLFEFMSGNEALFSIIIVTNNKEIIDQCSKKTDVKTVQRETS